MNLRAAQVRIYIDADILGLGKILASLRNDVTYPGDPGAFVHKRQRPPCPIARPDVLDTHAVHLLVAGALAAQLGRHPDTTRGNRGGGSRLDRVVSAPGLSRSPSNTGASWAAPAGRRHLRGPPPLATPAVWHGRPEAHAGRGLMARAGHGGVFSRRGPAGSTRRADPSGPRARTTRESSHQAGPGSCRAARSPATCRSGP